MMSASTLQVGGVRRHKYLIITEIQDQIPSQNLGGGNPTLDTAAQVGK